MKHFLGFTFLSIVLAFPNFSKLAADSDPLFIRMIGQWSAQGERISLKTGRKVHLQAKVTSSLINNVLFSTNEWTETLITEDPHPPPPRRYILRYWIRPKVNRSYEYELGSVEKPSTITGNGVFTDSLFQVTQFFKGPPEFEIFSQTQFNPLHFNESHYIEKVWMNASPHSESHVLYQRIPSSSSPFETHLQRLFLLPLAENPVSY